MIALAWSLVGLAALAMASALTFALMNSRARDQREAARVLASSTAGELVRAREVITKLTADLKLEQERADALDDELATTYDAPDPVGARQRVLSKWKAHHDAARRGGAVSLPAPAPARTTGSDDLLRPGD